MTSLFISVEKLPDDPILGLTAAFDAEKNKSKVNLGIGAYKNDQGNPEVLECVRKAEAILIEQQLDKEYSPILGSSNYLLSTQKLIFGQNSTDTFDRISSVQTIGGTGALRLGGEFLVQNNISKLIFVSDPTWTNHKEIFTKAGMKVETYPYFDFNTHTLNFVSMRDSLQKMPIGSVILLQPCAHNPTGVCPTFENWQELSSLIKKYRLIPFFDLAYQGLDQGIDEDAKVIRYFLQEGHEMLVANSYSKNFGLYGERIGMLSVINQDKKTVEAVSSQFKRITRGIYSTPPLQGQRIITQILSSEPLKAEWIQELDKMRERIQNMREALVLGLQAHTEKFQFLTKQTGMFSFSCLSENQVERLREEFGIYTPKNGRINIAGLNSTNIDYVIEALLSVS